MQEALDGGASLILFPEGTRNETDAPLQPFKAGLYHLARARPQLELVPVWIENLNRVMPKGEFIPVPLMCTVHLRPRAPVDRGRDHRSLPRPRPRCASGSQARPQGAPHDRIHPRPPQPADRRRRHPRRRFRRRRRAAAAASPDGSNKSIENLNDRIRAWWVMAAASRHRLCRRQGRRHPALRASAPSRRCASS